MYLIEKFLRIKLNKEKRDVSMALPAGLIENITSYIDRIAHLISHGYYNEIQKFVNEIQQ